MLTSVLPNRVTPRIKKIRNTRNCRANNACMASTPGLKSSRNSTTTGIAAVIQPGTNGTPIMAGSMKPMPQTTT